MNVENNSVEKIFEITPGGIKILKESFICLNDLREILAKLSFLGNRLSQIKTKNARVYCSISCNWDFEIYVVRHSFRGSRYRFKPENMVIVFEIDWDIPNPEVDEILEKIFEILKSPELKKMILDIYCYSKKRDLSIRENGGLGVRLSQNLKDEK